MAWKTPDKDEAKLLNAAMAFKAVRLIRYWLILSCYVSLIVFIRSLDIEQNIKTASIGAACLPVVIFYWAHRNALVFGKRHALDEEISDTTAVRLVWLVFNTVVMLPLFFVFAVRMGVVSYVLIAVMAVATYWKEEFMLILFVMKKYTIKNGDVYYHQKMRSLTVLPGTRMPWTSLVYLLNFEDEEGRLIPVMADRYTFGRFKEKHDAVLINYQYGENYLFEIVRKK